MILFCRLTAQQFRVQLASWSNVIFLVLLLAVFAAGFLGMAMEQNLTSDFYSFQLRQGETAYALPIWSMGPGSVHTQVWSAVSHRFLHSYPALGGVLLPMRFVAIWLAFILPLAALILTFKSVSAEIESGTAATLFSLPVSRSVVVLSKITGLALACATSILLGISGALLIAVRLTGAEWTAPQLVRVAAFLAVSGLYTLLFALLGCLISARARSSARSLRMVVCVVISIFGIHVMLGNILGAAQPRVPEEPPMSPEVVSYLHGLRASPLAGPDELPPAVADYIVALETYSAEVYRSVSSRYQVERWVAVVSPASLFLELGSQLLQDQYAEPVQVFAALPQGASPASSPARSVAVIAPELAFLALCIAGLFVANIHTVSRLEV